MMQNRSNQTRTNTARAMLVAGLLLLGVAWVVSPASAQSPTTTLGTSTTATTGPLTLPVTTTTVASTTTAGPTTTAGATTTAPSTTVVATSTVPGSPTTTAAPASTAPVEPETTVAEGPPVVDSLSAPSGAPGDTIVVTGENFVIGETVVLLDGEPVEAEVSPGRAVGSTLAFVVPDRPLGAVELIIETAFGRSAPVTFTVTEGSSDPAPAPAPAPGGAQGSGGLARTGAPIGFFAILGGVLLVAGGLAMLAARRTT